MTKFTIDSEAQAAYQTQVEVGLLEGTHDRYLERRSRDDPDSQKLSRKFCR